MPAAKGEHNASAKLTEADVRAIRRDTRGLKAVAYEYNISSAHVWRIRNRVKWAHVDDDEPRTTRQ